ncbi:MAG: nitroreductase [Parvularculaceae bacterium]|nr:nitroreductase [Parvularculaceae bacterium]
MKFTPPAFGEETPAAFPSDDIQQLLALRRSTSADQLCEPGPKDAELAEMLRMAARVPDHRRVTPFRFIVFQGRGRDAAAGLMAASFRKQNPDAEDAAIAVEERRFARAPLIVCLVASPDRSHKTPEWEQMLTVGAVGLNLLHAASSYGYAAQWLTEWYAYDEEFCREIGVADGESVAGFFYIGSAKAPPRERARPDMAHIVTHFVGRL